MADWKSHLGESILSNEVARIFCVRLVDGLCDLLMRGQFDGSKWKPLHGQILIFRSEDEFAHAPAELKTAREKATSYRTSNFIDGCYKHHFSHENPLHDGFLLVVGWEWVNAKLFLPSLGEPTSASGGSGTRAAIQASINCPQALVFLVSEDRESLSAVRRGDKTILGDKTLPNIIEQHVKTSIAHVLLGFYSTGSDLHGSLNAISKTIDTIDASTVLAHPASPSDNMSSGMTGICNSTVPVSAFPGASENYGSGQICRTDRLELLGDSCDLLFKILLIGDSRVGKTSLLMSFTSNEFDKDSQNTIGIEFKCARVAFNHKVIKAQIWDTAGQKAYREVRTPFYKCAHGALLVYDVTCKQSFENLTAWLKELYENAGPNVLTIIVGNKTDLESKRAIKEREAREFAAAHGLVYIETSAKTSSRVDDAFRTLLTEIYARPELRDHPAQPVEAVSTRCGDARSDAQSASRYLMCPRCLNCWR